MDGDDDEDRVGNKEMEREDFVFLLYV